MTAVLEVLALQCAARHIPANACERAKSKKAARLSRQSHDSHSRAAHVTVALEVVVEVHPCLKLRQRQSFQGRDL